MLPASPRSGLTPEHAYFLFLFEKREKESQSKASGRKRRPVRKLLLFRVNESLVQVSLQVTLCCCASSQGLLPVPGVLHGRALQNTAIDLQTVSDEAIYQVTAHLCVSVELQSCRM